MQSVSLCELRMAQPSLKIETVWEITDCIECTDCIDCIDCITVTISL